MHFVTIRSGLVFCSQPRGRSAQLRNGHRGHVHSALHDRHLSRHRPVRGDHQAAAQSHSHRRPDASESARPQAVLPDRLHRGDAGLLVAVSRHARAADGPRSANDDFQAHLDGWCRSVGLCIENVYEYMKHVLKLAKQINLVRYLNNKYLSLPVCKIDDILVTMRKRNHFLTSRNILIIK